jgi:signal transduction histidine kinase
MPREELALERGLLTGIAAFRWAALAWAAITFAIDATRPPDVAHAATGWALLIAALAWTTVASVLVRRDPRRLLDWWSVAVELAIAAAMSFLDWFVYGTGNEHLQSFGSVWPLAVVLTAGVSGAGRAGFVAGLALGVVRAAGQAAFDPDSMAHGGNQLGLMGSVVLYALAGGVAGFVAIKLREAERQIAIARAREEVARTLHDGVLQTLAIVQRRAQDDDLVALAREQEHELRQYLFAPTADVRRLARSGTSDLATVLRDVAAEAERRHQLRCQVVVVGEPGMVPEDVADAFAGAVRESLTNAAKHGGATTATVYLEGEDGHDLFCSIKDDGAGFDPATTAPGIGTTRSIKGRIDEVGGTAEIEGRPGRGTEARLRLSR